jgi:hypothetical protein
LVRRTSLASTLALLIVAAVLVCAQPDVARIGPQVGQPAIDFKLVDQTGRTQSLETVAGPKGTMLVFFRSADW